MAASFAQGCPVKSVITRSSGFNPALHVSGRCCQDALFVETNAEIAFFAANIASLVGKSAHFEQILPCFCLVDCLAQFW